MTQLTHNVAQKPQQQQQQTQQQQQLTATQGTSASNANGVNSNSGVSNNNSNNNPNTYAPPVVGAPPSAQAIYNQPMHAANIYMPAHGVHQPVGGAAAAVYSTMIPASNVFVNNVTANVNLHGWPHTVPAYIPGGTPQFIHGEIPPDQNGAIMQPMPAIQPIALTSANAITGPTSSSSTTGSSGRGSRRGRGRGGSSTRRSDYNLQRHPANEGSPVPQSQQQQQQQQQQQSQEQLPQSISQSQQPSSQQQPIETQVMGGVQPYAAHPQYAYQYAAYPTAYYPPQNHMIHPAQAAAQQANGQPYYVPIYPGHQLYNYPGGVLYPQMINPEYQYLSAEEVQADDRQNPEGMIPQIWHSQHMYPEEYAINAGDMHGGAAGDDINQNASSLASSETPSMLSPGYSIYDPQMHDMQQQMSVMQIYDEQQLGQLQGIHPVGAMPQLEDEMSDCGAPAGTIQMVPAGTMLAPIHLQSDPQIVHLHGHPQAAPQHMIPAPMIAIEAHQQVQHIAEHVIVDNYNINNDVVTIQSGDSITNLSEMNQQSCENIAQEFQPQNNAEVFLQQEQQQPQESQKLTHHQQHQQQQHTVTIVSNYSSHNVSGSSSGGEVVPEHQEYQQNVSVVENLTTAVARTTTTTVVEPTEEENEVMAMPQQQPQYQRQHHMHQHHQQQQMQHHQQQQTQQQQQQMQQQHQQQPQPLQLQQPQQQYPKDQHHKDDQQMQQQTQPQSQQQQPQPQPQQKPQQQSQQEIQQKPQQQPQQQPQPQPQNQQSTHYQPQHQQQEYQYHQQQQQQPHLHHHQQQQQQQQTQHHHHQQDQDQYEAHDKQHSYQSQQQPHQQQQHYQKHQRTYNNNNSSHHDQQQHRKQPHHYMQQQQRNYIPRFHNNNNHNNNSNHSSNQQQNGSNNNNDTSAQTTKSMSWTNSYQKKSTATVSVTATPTSNNNTNKSQVNNYNKGYSNQQHHYQQQQHYQHQNHHQQQHHYNNQQQSQMRHHGTMKTPSSPPVLNAGSTNFERKQSQGDHQHQPHYQQQQHHQYQRSATTSTASTTAVPQQFPPQQQQQSHHMHQNDYSSSSSYAGTRNAQHHQQNYYVNKKHMATTTTAAATVDTAPATPAAPAPPMNLAPPVPITSTTTATSSSNTWASLFNNKSGSSPSTNFTVTTSATNTTTAQAPSMSPYTPYAANNSKKPVAKVAPYEGITPAIPAPPLVTPGAMSYSAASAKGLTPTSPPNNTSSAVTTASSIKVTKLDTVPANRHIDEWSLKFAEFLSKYKTDLTAISLRPRGLTNRSNYCYINSILQALLGCAPFYNLIRSIPKQAAALCDVKTPFINAMLSYMSNFSSLPTGLRLNNRLNKAGPKGKDNQGGELQCDSAFEPTEIYKLWNESRDEHVEGRQEDAEEFLGYVLNKLNDEMLEVIKLIAKPSAEQNGQDPLSENEDGDVWQMICNNRNKGSVTRQTDFGHTPLSEIFRGELRSRLQREGEHSTDVIQPFFTLQLNIEKAASVKEALEILVGRDQLEGVTGSKSKQEVVAWQQMTLEKLPVILILHLKWFDYRSDGCTKILKTVEFPVELKIDPKILASKKYSQKQRNYRLFAVVYHDGKEASKGHYITDVYHTGYSSWLRFDDSSVKPVSEHNVLHPHMPRVPYLLYYRRCDTLPQTPQTANNSNASPSMGNQSGQTTARDNK